MILKGARGIKSIDWLYSEITKNLIDEIDSQNMYKVYQIARKYKVPVLLHIDFYKNKKWEEQFERAVKDFPDVVFILAHYASCINNYPFDHLSLANKFLDKFSNVYLDISSGNSIKNYMRLIDENKKIFYDFFIYNQDKLLWGADIVLESNRYNNFEEILRRLMLEFLILQRKIYRDPFHYIDKGTYRGLELPEEVLEKIYYQNAVKILRLQNENPNN